MLHSYTKIFVHLIWSTKSREKFLVKETRPLVYHHLLEYAKTKDILIDTLSVQIEHVHMLIILRSDQKVDDVVKLLKGESSHWINGENLIRPKFAWQRGYGAFSVSPSHVETIREYINNQDEHHRKKRSVRNGTQFSENMVLRGWKPMNRFLNDYIFPQ